MSSNDLEFTNEDHETYSFTEVGEDAVVARRDILNSVPVPEWIILHPELSDRARTLWMVLAIASRGTLGIPDTSHETLAARMDVSVPTLRRAVYELRDAGAITVLERFQKGRQKGNLYVLWPATEDGLRVITGDQGDHTRSPRVITGDQPISNPNERDNVHSDSKAKRARRTYTDQFAAVWAEYPRKVNKAGAESAFTARLRAGASFPDLLAATMAYAETRKGEEEQFTMHGATFFGPADRWRDFLPAAPIVIDTEAALIFDDWDRDGRWVVPGGDWCVDNPVKSGYTRPTNAEGHFVAADGTTYELNAQGRRVRVGFNN